MIRRSLLVVGLLLASASALHAGTYGGARDSVSYTNHIDLRQAEGHPDHLGVDFDLRYTRLRSPEDATRNYNLQIAANGYQAFDRAIRDVDHMSAEVSLGGLRYVAGNDALTASELARQAKYAENAPENGGHLLPAEQADYDRIMRKLVAPGRLWVYDLHYRLETNHDVSLKQHAFGVGGASTIPFLHELLDIIPSATRRVEFHPQPARAYAAVEYVSPDKDTTLAWLKGHANSLWRVRADVVWRTKILDGIDVRATWRGDYFPGAPAFVRSAGREFNSYLEAWLIYPLSGKSSSGVMVRYLDGRPAPTYGQVTGAKLGLTMSLK